MDQFFDAAGYSLKNILFFQLIIRVCCNLLAIRQVFPCFLVVCVNLWIFWWFFESSAFFNLPDYPRSSPRLSPIIPDHSPIVPDRPGCLDHPSLAQLSRKGRKSPDCLAKALNISGRAWNVSEKVGVFLIVSQTLKMSLEMPELFLAELEQCQYVWAKINEIRIPNHMLLQFRFRVKITEIGFPIHIRKGGLQNQFQFLAPNITHEIDIHNTLHHLLEIACNPSQPQTCSPVDKGKLLKSMPARCWRPARSRNPCSVAAKHVLIHEDHCDKQLTIQKRNNKGILELNFVAGSNHNL